MIHKGLVGTYLIQDGIENSMIIYNQFLCQKVRAKLSLFLLQSLYGDYREVLYGREACSRRVPAQDVLFALIIWHVAKTLFRS